MAKSKCIITILKCGITFWKWETKRREKWRKSGVSRAMPPGSGASHQTFPFLGEKHFWKEIVQHYVRTVESCTTSNSAQLNPIYSMELFQYCWMTFLFRLILQGFWCCVHHSLTCQRQTMPRLLKSTLATFHQTRSRESVDLKHFQRLNGPWTSNF